MFKAIAKKILGSRNDRYIKSLAPLVARIGDLEASVQPLDQAAMQARIAKMRQEVQNGRPLDELLPEVFALVREASVRALGMRHFDVQLIGGITLHQGKIAEMKTGEGKTLVATLPVVLNALSGKGVHLITVNDYLARRDAAWMGKLYEYLGLTVGVIVHGLSDQERQQAYGADITYGTNNEFGFDYLRDNMKFYKEQLVQRPLNYAIVDEVDSILIDEARTPLIISGPAEESTALYSKIDAIIPSLKLDTHFTLDEKGKSVLISEEGVARCEQILGVENLYDPANVSLQHHVLQGLRAHHLYQRDVDYIVKEGQVVIVDEFTGRLMPGRRYSDGLHQALEAKEGVKVEAENQTLASITFQNYFRMYEKLSGMTGTADTEAVEFKQIYDLEVISIPTHRNMVRKDFPDLIYKSQADKFKAIASDVKELHRKGQPVLVGTVSIEKSELLSGLLKKEGVPHDVLNAKQHEKEAEIVALAGHKGRVTIATNMAGRGTDIVLGEGVVDLGGLHILGTERHESRRIDNQLRGRAGRQGDPGSSRFYLALDDDLMRLFGSDRIAGIMDKLGMEEGEAIENRMVTKAIENAQKRVEAHNFDIRKQLLEYDNVMNQQREVIYSLRREVMVTETPEALIEGWIEELLDEVFEPLASSKGDHDPEALEATAARIEEMFTVRAEIKTGDDSEKEAVRQAVAAQLETLRVGAGEHYREIARYFLLESLDRNWKEHLLSMDHLRDGIGLRGYGQKDPKQEYKREGFTLFQSLIFTIKDASVRALCRVRIRTEVREEEFQHKQEPAGEVQYSGGSDTGERKKQPKRRDAPKVGPNDPCPCGSGKKYKKCCRK
ncbi:preprotein translocase subunit SecA [Desulfovibrio sulfodismutans]|uniref:Protein translocase subunit SecA n=1 Tax=Desulfolutivibrio sulfodismutans TaxID=63561 RepID=A0A7K3NRT6_9BACT|nr:preprotein translocase subunit SecA [Desulfolutivibrio sulfodismutans]NDY58900.1 preprotein translocase subunit SecA [Desulfolutivibrio sulfodismutans]QLA12570.1 preprotein translocase subunit SecA [Desulfolutivibrio sulfodismutans DSM 3696]